MKVREERNPWLHLGKHRRCTHRDHLLRASPQSPEQKGVIFKKVIRSEKFGMRLTEQESAILTSKAKRCDLTRSEFLRRVMLDVPISEKPPADVPTLIDEVRRVGNAINQLLLLANATGTIDTSQLRCALDAQIELYNKINTVYSDKGE